MISVEGFGNFPLLSSGRVVYNTWGAKRNSTLERIANISVSVLALTIMALLMFLSKMT
jgi:hypothetical protein